MNLTNIGIALLIMLNVMVIIFSHHSDYRLNALGDICFILMIGGMLVTVSSFLLGDPFRLRKLYWMYELRKVSANDGLNLIALLDPFIILPKRLKTKEFLISTIKINNIHNYSTLNEVLCAVNIDIDYDVVIAFELNRLDAGFGYKRNIDDLYQMYGKYLTKEDTDKLHITLSLLS